MYCTQTDQRSVRLWTVLCRCLVAVRYHLHQDNTLSSGTPSAFFLRCDPRHLINSSECVTSLLRDHSRSPNSGARLRKLLVGRFGAQVVSGNSEFSCASVRLICAVHRLLVLGVWRGPGLAMGRSRLAVALRLDNGGHMHAWPGAVAATRFPQDTAPRTAPLTPRSPRR